MQTVISNFDFLKPIFDFELFKVCLQDKEDVKQTAILRILTSLKNPRYTVTEKTLFSFALIIVRRTVTDYYRLAGRMIEQKSTPVNFCDDVDKQTGSGGTEAFSSIVFDNGYNVADIRIDYENSKSEFTPKERRIIEYLLFTKYGTGMNMADISAELGINKSHATRAIKKLRNICNV